MELFLIVISLIGAFAAGFAVKSFYTERRLLNEMAVIDFERQQWINKVLVRDGSTPIFAPQPQASKSKAKTTPLKTPLAQRQTKLRDKIKEEKNPTSNLPDVVKQNIKKAMAN